MLQGNPYEAELEIRERTQMVRREAARERRPQPGPAIITPLRQRLRELQPMRAWWVPAAIALGTLAGLVLRGF